MICELAKQYGIENLRFILKEAPLRSCGFICYTTSSDERLEAGRLIDGLAVRPMKARKLIRICLMSATREMPKYECHKKVWALKIAGIVGDQHGGVYFQPAEEGYDKVPMSPEYVAKHKPEVGGYYVVYEDGYKSFSPAGAFESGYTPL